MCTPNITVPMAIPFGRTRINGRDNISILHPATLSAACRKIHYDPSQSQSFSIKLDSVLPANNLPADTKQVKHIKIRSKILSNFWGHDMYLGATILLPKGFDEHPNVHYPVVYEQSHFGLGAPDGFTTPKQADTTSL